MKSLPVIPFIMTVLLVTACKGLTKKDFPEEHSKLIQTIGHPNYGNVQCMMQDKAGNLWFGTTENGLYKYDGRSFKQFLVTDGLISNNVFCLLEDKNGKFWIGTETGLCLYDGRTFSNIRIPVRKNQPPNKNELYRNSHWVFSILQSRSGKLWFATIDGVYVYDGKSFTPFIIDEKAGGFLSSNNNAEFMLEDNAGNIWFGGRGSKGVYRYDGTSITNFLLQGFITRRFDSTSVLHDWAWPQLQDKDGNIWFSNWGGAYRYDGNTFTRVTKKDGLPGEMVTRMIEDKRGNLWIGGAGLSRYDGKAFTRFTANDGLSNQGVWSMLEDKSGSLWVGTRGTSLFRYDGKRFTLYSEYKQAH